MNASKSTLVSSYSRLGSGSKDSPPFSLSSSRLIDALSSIKSLVALSLCLLVLHPLPSLILVCRQSAATSAVDLRIGTVVVVASRLVLLRRSSLLVDSLLTQ